MFSVNTCTLPSQFPPPYPCRRLCRLTVVCAPFRRRSRSRRRHNKLSLPPTTSSSSSSEPKFEAVIDLTPLTTFQSDLRRFILSGKDAYLDLQTLLTLDHNRRLVVSCRPSTLHFLGTSAALTLLTFSVFSVLARLISRFSSWRRSASNNVSLVVRRDRSLGGKEVVVALGQRSNSNPLSPAVRDSVKRSAKNMVRFERKLPEWWPSVVNSNGSVFDADEQEEYKREAYRVVRGLFSISASYFQRS